MQIPDCITLPITSFMTHIAHNSLTLVDHSAEQTVLLTVTHKKEAYRSSQVMDAQQVVRLFLFF